MNMRRPPKAIVLHEDVRANVARIDALWSGCRARFGNGGPFLFGRFTAADAMYAPIVSRFASYAMPVSPEAWSYMNTLRDLPAWAEWDTAARAESWTMPRNEV
jgi:glutathione S-transferase